MTKYSEFLIIRLKNKKLYQVLILKIKYIREKMEEKAMKIMEIEGGRELSGTIRVSGAKNATVALIPAAI